MFYMPYAITLTFPFSYMSQGWQLVYGDTADTYMQTQCSKMVHEVNNFLQTEELFSEMKWGKVRCSDR